jgi:hypothetical protein
MKNIKIRLITRAFNRYIRSKQPLKAALAKNFFSLVGCTISIVWLIGWGLTSIYNDPSTLLATLKIVSFIVGYISISLNFIHSYKNIFRKLETYELKRNFKKKLQAYEESCKKE